MTLGTEPNDLPIGVTLSQRNKEILLAAREFENVLARHGLTFPSFAIEFYDKGSEWTADLAVCQRQLREDRGAEIQEALNKLSDKEKALLKQHFEVYAA